MHNILIITACLFAHQLHAQSKLMVEQYAYTGSGLRNYVSPMAHYETTKNWYAEVRYNYEEMQTFSVHAGKTFCWEKKMEYSFTPMLGIMAGNLQGGSLGLNVDISRNQFYFSTQSQYCMSVEDNSFNFLYSWSEVAYQPFDWMYAGLSMQYTQCPKTAPLIEPGLLLAFTIRQWTFPFYSFHVFNNDRYYMLGMNYEWKHGKK
jgi:hypothetical protein